MTLVSIIATIALVWTMIIQIKWTKRLRKEYESLIELETLLGMKGVIGNDIRKRRD